jgi:Helix-turn-helix of DDE superfamily endonuclease/DDE superfamily endonuclease
MLSYEGLSKRPETFRSFTGLEVSEFDSIYAKVEPRYVEFERKRLSRADRTNDIGAGRPFKLSLRDRLLMFLVYYRTYITSTLSGFLFGLDQSNVLKDIRMLEPLVRECVPIPKKVYEGARRARTLEEVEEFFPGFKAFVDSTEQEIPRPKKDTRKRKTHYSGKKKRHTVKTQLTVNSKGAIVHKTNHARGGGTTSTSTGRGTPTSQSRSRESSTWGTRAS